MPGHEPVIIASVGVKNAYEINSFRYTISSQTQNRIDADMVMVESNVRTMLYSYANIATITVPPECERDDTPLSDDGTERLRMRPCVLVDRVPPITEGRSLYNEEVGISTKDIDINLM